MTKVPQKAGPISANTSSSSTVKGEVGTGGAHGSTSTKLNVVQHKQLKRCQSNGQQARQQWWPETTAVGSTCMYQHPCMHSSTHAHG
jgi:hypothetical protein